MLSLVLAYFLTLFRHLNTNKVFTSRFSGMVMGWVGMFFLLFFWGRLAF